MDGGLFQRRVAQWIEACFPAYACTDLEERIHRFLEESLELAQAVGCSREDAHRLVDYVFSRPADQPEREVGGVMVTLAALCSVANLDMDRAGDAELARNWVRIDAIRKKQAARPIGSPLPQ